MIRMRIPTKNDYELMSPIIEKHQINKDLLQLSEKNTFIMIEKNKIIGLSRYFIYNKIGVINLMAYDIDLMDNSYRDAFFRGTLNLMLNNGLFEGIILTTKENNSIYKDYGFEAVDKNIIHELKKKNLNLNDVISAFRVDIESFFNKPCDE
jgi:hypothetical protein